MQAFKFQDTKKQLESCGRRGYWAQRIGHSGDGWKKNQILYWKDKEYKRDSKEYQELLDRLFNECYSQNTKARETLMKTGYAILTHERGKTDKKDTVLTAEEFIIRLVRIREELSK
ncbi:Bacteriophage protein GP30 [Thermoplasmatales archaeon SCGC AB-540-F20]|nr:Bacteriophage protein GP30 [Thermoplasmatales archaeon SCGC AB-540-F20]